MYSSIYYQLKSTFLLNDLSLQQFLVMKNLLKAFQLPAQPEQAQVMPLSKSNENIFALMHAGDILVEGIKSRVTMIVGKSRTGKSTFFNWVINQPLIGVYNNAKQLSYQTVGDESAKVGDGYNSVTTLPNKYESGEDVLFDMAGFYDSGRNASTVLIVSYMLKAVMDKARELRFALVIKESTIISSNSDQLFSIIDAFFRMFTTETIKVKEDDMLEVIGCILNSVKLVVTCSTQPEAIVPSLDKIIYYLKSKDSEGVRNRMYIYALITMLKNNNRIFKFPNAKINEKAPPSKFLSEEEDKNWPYFNLLTHTNGVGQPLKYAMQEMTPSMVHADNESMAEYDRKENLRRQKYEQAAKYEEMKKLQDVKKILFVLPFKEEYEKLRDPEKKYLKDVIEKRISSFQVYIQILKDIFSQMQKECTEICLDTPQITELKDSICLFAYDNKKQKNSPAVKREVAERTKRLIALKTRVVEEELRVQAESTLPHRAQQIQKLNREKERIDRLSHLCAKAQEYQDFVNRIVDECDWHDKYFRRFQAYLQENDCYNLGKIHAQSKTTTRNTVGILLLRNMLTAFQYTTCLKDAVQFDDMLQFQSYLIQNYVKLAHIIKANFCGAAYRETLLLRVEYVLRRGNREMNMLYCIAEKEVQACFRSLKDKLQDMFLNKNPLQIIEHYFESTTRRIKAQHLRTQEERVCFMGLLDRLAGKTLRDQLLFTRTHITMHQIVLEYLSRQQVSKEWNEKAKAKSILKETLQLIPAIDNYEDYYQAKSLESECDDKEKTAELNLIIIKRTQCLKEMIKCLEKLQMYFEALQLAICIKCVYSTCRLFRKRIDKESSVEKKKDYIDEYAKFCIKWGRSTQAISLYQEKIFLSNDINQMRDIAKCILDIEEKPAMFSFEAKKHYKELKFLGSHDHEIQNIAKRIDKKVFQIQKQDDCDDD